MLCKFTFSLSIIRYHGHHPCCSILHTLISDKLCSLFYQHTTFNFQHAYMSQPSYHASRHRHIHSVRRSLTRQTVLTLVRSLVVSKVDYCNSVLAGVHAPFGQTVDYAACRCRADLLGKEVGTHRPITLWTSLVASSGENPIPAVRSGISLPSRHSAIVPCWQSTPCRRCRRSSSPPLGQHSVAGRSTTQCTTLGDRAFPVVAARACNDLPPTIMASLSLLTFRQQLKIFLFQKNILLT